MSQTDKPRTLRQHLGRRIRLGNRALRQAMRAKRDWHRELRSFWHLYRLAVQLVPRQHWTPEWLAVRERVDAGQLPAGLRRMGRFE